MQVLEEKPHMPECSAEQNWDVKACILSAAGSTIGRGRHVCDNWCGISLLDVVSKLLAKIMLEQVQRIACRGDLI